MWQTLSNFSEKRYKCHLKKLDETKKYIIYKNYFVKNLNKKIIFSQIQKKHKIFLFKGC
jgi:hypothetical protein